MHDNYTLKEIESFVTISQSQFDDLKIDTGDTRVWLSRMTIEDGQPYNNQITVERLQYRDNYNGKQDSTAPRWIITKQYEAK